MDVDSDLISVVLSMNIDFWGADKKQRFSNINDEIPVVRGGLSAEEIERMVQADWVLEETKEDIPVWPVGFGSEVAGEIVVKWGPIPRGTQILKNPGIRIDLVPQ